MNELNPDLKEKTMDVYIKINLNLFPWVDQCVAPGDGLSTRALNE